MQKITGYKTEDGKIYDNPGEAHDHEIRASVLELTSAEGVPLSFREFIATFVVVNKDKLLNILEKPKL